MTQTIRPCAIEFGRKNIAFFENLLSGEGAGRAFRISCFVVIASAAKQSSFDQKSQSGLLRCARNDAVGISKRSSSLLQPRALLRVEMGRKRISGPAFRRHCERSEAIHFCRHRRLDCFAALAMTRWEFQSATLAFFNHARSCASRWEGAFRVPPFAVIASGAKQSIFAADSQTGLLRCARNDACSFKSQQWPSSTTRALSRLRWGARAFRVPPFVVIASEAKQSMACGRGQGGLYVLHPRLWLTASPCEAAGRMTRSLLDRAQARKQS